MKRTIAARPASIFFCFYGIESLKGARDWSVEISGVGLCSNTGSGSDVVHSFCV